jgi:signal transduction histidine kinase
MVLNLLENAVQHTPAGTQIRAGTISDGHTARVVVEDDGPGIDPAIRVRVFERFVRGAGDGARGSGDGGRGSGLGLAIVRAVAESHGGEVILARPRHGQGTRFEIRIPQSPGQAIMPDATRQSARDGQSARNGRNGRRQTSTTTGSTIGRRRSRS